MSTVGGPPARGKLCRLATILAWGYLALMLCFWVFLRQGDDWWPATAALYCPRWPVAGLLLILAPAALRWPKRVLPPAGAAVVVFVWPVLGAVVNVRHFTERLADTRSLTVMSLNADGDRFSRATLESILAAESPDVVAVQEGSPSLLDAGFWGAGWNVQPGPAGLIIASRFQLVPVKTLELSAIGGSGGAASCRIDCPLGKVLLVDLHLDTPRGGLEALRGGRVDGMRTNIALRDAGSALVTRWLTDAPAASVVLGDFNLTPESAIYRRYWARCHDAFGEAGFGWGYTKHTSWHGARIDHILYGAAFRCVECRVGSDFGSDHRPLIAVLRPASAPPE